MKCPVDKSVMLVVEHRRIEMDYCTRCSGVWLDAGELELLIALLISEGAKAPGLEPDHSAAKDKLRCPICGLKMDRAWTGGEQKVLIDRCPAGHGLWFDAGELQKVLRGLCHPDSPQYEDVVSFMGNAFQAAYGQDETREK